MRMNMRKILERELAQAKRELFQAATIKQLHAIQDRIRYLNEKIKNFTR